MPLICTYLLFFVNLENHFHLTKIIYRYKLVLHLYLMLLLFAMFIAA